MKYGTLTSDGPWMTIVGVVADTRRTDYESAVRPETFLPFAQAPDNSMLVVVRTKSAPRAAAPSVRSIIRTIDPTVAVQSLRPLAEDVAEMIAGRRLNTLLLGAFAVIAALLAAVGLYGVIAYSVDQRTRELVVRVALGASGSSVLRMVLGEGFRLVSIGLVLGLLASVASSRLLTRLLYQVRATDPSTLAAIALMTLV